MPRQPRFSKDDIVAAGLRIVRSSGLEAVSARALGRELGTSSSPMFTMFKDMNEVMNGVTGYFPAFKEFGLRLVAFAKENNSV